MEIEMYPEEPPKGMRGRKAGSTNLKQCGWCDYAMGEHRHDYCTKGNCQLLASSSGILQVFWHDKCLLKGKSKSEIDMIVRAKKKEIEYSKDAIRNREAEIVMLGKFKKKCRYAPPLPNHRETEHFNIGEQVAVYLRSQWYFGEVRLGIRHHDGMVSYRLDEIGPQDANDYVFPFDNGFWNCGIYAPNILLKEEYEFFVKNKHEYKKWAGTAYAREYNGKRLEVAVIE